MEREGVIPKIIHYCWFGGKELPELEKRCIESWKKLLPEYEVKFWNEETFDINSNIYVKEAYQSKKYAFVSDYVRLYALYNDGGIYMDTDVEVIKPFDKFLHHHIFMGFEDGVNINTGTIGAVKGSKIIKELLDYYENRNFIVRDQLDLTTNVTIISNILKKYGFESNNKYQVIDSFALYPKTYFCPLNWGDSKRDFSKNTYAIHHFVGSWHSEEEQILLKKNRQRITGMIFRIKVKVANILLSLLGEGKYYKLYNKIKRTGK